MSTTIIMRRTIGGRLEPVDEMGREAMARVNSGLVSVTIKQPRNLGHHRKFFALLSVIYRNQTRYRSPDELLDALKVMLGHCTTLTLRDGREVCVPKSISFSAMSQIEFNDFWDRAVALICERILPGVSREDLEREILDLVA